MVYEICSKLTIKMPERRHWRRSGIFIVNFEHISHLLLVFLLLTLNMELPAGLLFEIYPSEIYEVCVYKHRETLGYVKE